MYPAPQIQSLPTTSLKPNAGNVRTHNGKQIAQLSRAIAEFGFISPIVTDSAFNALARAINEFGFVVPTIVDESLIDGLISDLLDSEHDPLDVLREGPQVYSLGRRCGCRWDIALWL